MKKTATPQTALILGMVLACLFCTTAALAVTDNANIRPLEDFLKQQGQDPVNYGGILFVPPDPNFMGWTNDLDSQVIYFAGVDYAGLLKDGVYKPGKEPQLSGTVIERPLKDGRAEVTVLLHSKNVNIWVINLDLGGDFLDQVKNKPTIFGHRPVDIRAGAKQALANAFLHVVFTIGYPGAPLPDLVQLLNFSEPINTQFKQDPKFVAFNASADGPLTAGYGVPENTPGKCTIVQTGFFPPKGKGKALQDWFPAEAINIRVIGKEAKK